ncbi:MAG: sigma factor-like helix-turn-helix DNA-binding protein [Candidatus Paceibacterota bacterium]
MTIITFTPKEVTKNLLAGLPERARNIAIHRYGLGKSPQKRTLESIGKEYGITRERVRQIENFALKTIKNSTVYEKEQKAITELREAILNLGAIVPEEELLSVITDTLQHQNHISFLLSLGEEFEKRREDTHFTHRWSVDEDISKRVHQALHSLYQELKEDDLISEDDMIVLFSKKLSEIPSAYKKKDILKRWLGLSRVIGRNQLGEWGLTSSPNIKARGIRDYAYLVIRQHGSPLHFSEVAGEIEKTFNRKAHTATCHNELIKDKARFALVGRGLYGLTEWGYSNGVVRDVIAKILKEEGPLPKDELIKKILKERYVKENTIVVNLQNKKHFKKDKKGNYYFV